MARSLLSADQPVRAVVRDRSRGAPWAQLGCDIAVADLSDTESLTAAFEDTAGVFAMAPPVFDPTPGFPEAMGFIDPLRAALARAKPAKVVALSTVGADAPQPKIQSGDPVLRDGTVFRCESQVHEYVLNQRLGWYGNAPGTKPSIYHSWCLEPRGAMCHVVMDEAGVGEDAAALRKSDETLMHRGHDLWLATLKWVAEAKKCRPGPPAP